MAQRTSPAERHATEVPSRPSRRPLSRRQRRELKRLERQLTGRRWRFGRRRTASAPQLPAQDLQGVIARQVRKAVAAERESIQREAEEEIERRMDELTEKMTRRQDRLMARAWEAFNRRARQPSRPRQRAKRKS